MNNNNNDNVDNTGYTEWLERVRAEQHDWPRERPLRQDFNERNLIEKNQILSQEVSDLQKQLQEAHKRIKELIDRSIISM